MEEFRKFVERYEKIPDQEWELIARQFHRTEVPNNFNILEQGRVCKSLYFLEKGLLRYFVLKDGNEVTKFFTIAPYCFTSQASFSSKKRANEFIQTIEPSIIWETSYEQNEKLLELQSWNSFVRYRQIRTVTMDYMHRNAHHKSGMNIVSLEIRVMAVKL